MKRLFVIIAALVLGGVSEIFCQTIDAPVATVKLTKSEVISSRQFAADVEKLEKSSGRKLTTEERRAYLDAKVNDLLFFQMCDRDRISVSEGEITSAISTMKARLGPGATDAQFEAALKTQNVQMADVRSYFKQMLLLQRYMETKKADALKVPEPTSEEIKQTYELYKTQFIRPDTVRVSVIYIDTRGKGVDERKKAGEFMRAMAPQIKSNSSKFDEAVLKASDADSGYKANASFMVSRTPDMLKFYGQQFLDAVFKMDSGQISDVIENEAGYQIVRINDVYKQKQLTLSDPVQLGQAATVMDLIRDQLSQQKQAAVKQKIMQDLILDLRKQATIKIFEENLK